MGKEAPRRFKIKIIYFYYHVVISHTLFNLAIYDDPQFYIILTNISIACGIIGTGVVIFTKLKVWLNNMTSNAVKEVKRDNNEVALNLTSKLEINHKCIQRLEDNIQISNTADRRDIDDLRKQLSDIRSTLDARSPYFEKLLLSIEEIKEWELHHDFSDTEQFKSIKDMLAKLETEQETNNLR